MCVRLCFAIFMIAQLARADETPPGGAVQAVAKLDGPKVAAPGEHVVISAKGTVGKDPKFDCFPPNKNWTAARALANEDMHISFATLEQGTYTFVLAVNSSSQTALTSYTLTIGQPPPLPPAAFPEVLAKAYSQESSVDNRLKLIAFLKEMVNQIDSFNGNFNDFDIFLKKSGESYLGKGSQGILPLTRKVIGDYLLVKLGAPSKNPLDKNLTKTSFSDAITALVSLTP